MVKFLPAAVTALAIGVFATAAPAAAQYNQRIDNNLEVCDGRGPAVRVIVNGIRASTGTIRVQSYRATAGEWLAKGRWLSRIELPARQGSMAFCVPLSAAGTYGIAVRHDANGNGKTNIREDGGGMSNNPPINIFNLGKPSYRQTAIAVGNEVKSITINMRYM